MCNDTELTRILQEYREMCAGMFDGGQREIIEAALQRLTLEEARELLADARKVYAKLKEAAAATDSLEKENWNEFVARHKS